MCVCVCVCCAVTGIINSTVRVEQTMTFLEHLVEVLDEKKIPHTKDTPFGLVVGPGSPLVEYVECLFVSLALPNLICFRLGRAETQHNMCHCSCLAIGFVYCVFADVWTCVVWQAVQRCGTALLPCALR